MGGLYNFILLEKGEGVVMVIIVSISFIEYPIETRYSSIEYHDLGLRFKSTIVPSLRRGGERGSKLSDVR